MPEVRVGIIQVSPAVVSPDGQSHAYTFGRALVSDLSVVEGVKSLSLSAGVGGMEESK
jgi:hypothetical protein